MNFKVQRFPKNNQYYTEKTITNTDPNKGVVGTFKTVFGQIITDKGKFVCYCFERFDTLIPEGTYAYVFYDSPANQLTVPLLVDVPHFDKIEVHPANWAFQLKGCCAPCISIDLKIPQGSSSKTAWLMLIGLMNNEEGEITYETLK